MNPTCFLEDKILNIKDKYQINNYIMFDAIDYDELKYFYLLRTMKNEESYYKKLNFTLKMCKVPLHLLSCCVDIYGFELLHL